MKKGRCGTVPHDYKRSGTTTFFAALNVLDGAVIGTCMPKHRQQECLKFMKIIDGEIEKNKELHPIVDNYSTHKTPRVRQWLAKNPRFIMHFTHTSSSRLNTVKSLFRDTTEKRSRRGIFTSVPELVSGIEEYPEQHNAEPTPNIWTRSAIDILVKVQRAYQSQDKTESS